MTLAVGKAAKHAGAKHIDSYHAKWLQLGFSQELYFSHPELVYFLINTGLAFGMALFKAKIPLEKGEPHLLVDGVYTPWSAVEKEMGFTYLGDRGIVKMGRTPYPIPHVASLDAIDHTALKQHAGCTSEKPCVLQVVTTYEGMLTKHTSIRLVDEEAKVYSFGHEITQEFEEYLNERSCAFLATGYSKLGTPDYRDTRSYDERIATWVPITTKGLTAILDYANEVNKSDGQPFCITNQNCGSLAVAALSFAGIRLDLRSTVFELLPLVDKIKSVAEKIFSYVPKPIVKVVDAVLYIPNKIATLATNALYMAFGSTHIRSWHDLFDAEKSYILNPYRLVAWQKQHTSTRIFGPTKVPQMNLLPK